MNHRWPLVALVVSCIAWPAPGKEPSDAAFERYRAVVEGIRGLRFKRPVPAVTLSPAQLRAFLRGAGAPSDPPQEAPPDGTEAGWKALGLIPVRVDLTRAEEVEDQDSVGGFYVQDDGSPPFKKGSLVLVRRPGDDLVEVTAHELLHALHDQNFDLDRLRRALPRTPTGGHELDAKLADDALEEGVATLFGEEIARKLGSGGSVPDRPSPFEIPDWVGAKADFPYSAGARFAKALRDHGGLKRVNEAYRSPPTSTEQILHPERFLRPNRDLPSEVELADMSGALPGRWETVDINGLGELGVGWLAGSRAGAGWDGDRYQVIQSPSTGQTVVSWQTTWDTPRDAAEFRLDLARSEKAVRGMRPGALMVLQQRGKDVFVASGVKADQVRAILQRASSNRVRKRPGDDDSWPGRRPPRDLLARLLETATSGTTLVRRGSKPRSSSRVGTFVLSPHGRRLAEAAMGRLAARARRDPGVRDLGDGRFAFRGGKTLRYTGGVLTLASGDPRAVRDLLKLSQRLDRPRPPARRTSTGAAAALGRLFE